jgi:hypothetical protein
MQGLQVLVNYGPNSDILHSPKLVDPTSEDPLISGYSEFRLLKKASTSNLNNAATEHPMLQTDISQLLCYYFKACFSLFLQNVGLPLLEMRYNIANVDRTTLLQVDSI